MKKAILLSLILAISLSFSAHALPLWDDDGWDDITNDKSNNLDTYDDKHYGYTEEDYTGYYIGTIDGNTTQTGNDLMYQAIAHYLSYNPANMEREKVDDIENISGTSYTENDLTVSWDDSLKSGVWSLSDSVHNYEMNFYAVKGGPEFALYYVHPSASSGSWTTRHLLNNGGNNPAISHFSAAYSNPGLTAVPEPATMLLFGTGLIGLAWVGRKQLQRRKDA